MKQTRMKRAIPAMVMTALAAIPAGQALAATHHAATQAKSKATKGKTYKGPLVNMRWGPVRAIIVVKGTKITKVKIATSPENFRSHFIDQQAVPILKQETLQAQTQTSTINTISGATMTSDAFLQSLQAALQKAHLQTS